MCVVYSVCVLREEIRMYINMHVYLYTRIDCIIKTRRMHEKQKCSLQGNAFYRCCDV